MRALILVDIQNDFVPSGALAVPKGREVVAVANQVMGNYELVVATQDWHPEDHGSFASQHPGLAVGAIFEWNGQPQVAWPDHCIQGTFGAELISDLETDRIQKVFRKGMDRAIDSYSGFFDNDHRSSTGMGEYLQSRGVTEVDVMGLATDYCVRFTALDARRLGFKTNLLRSGCRGVELQSGDIERAIQEMEAAGVTIL